MKTIVLAAALAASVCLPAPAFSQSFAGSKPVRTQTVPVFDADDEGVLPLSMSTPLGDATLLVYKGWAILSVANIQLAMAPLVAIPLLPGMLNATVGTTGCWMHLSPQGILSGPQSFTVTGTGSTLGGAVAAYKEAVETMESMGWVQVAGDCDGGGTGT